MQARSSKIVLYVVSLTDPHYLSNFIFFARFGIKVGCSSSEELDELNNDYRQ